MRGTPEDIQLMQDLRFDIDDDDAPAPENVPIPNVQREQTEENNEEGLYEGRSWGWSGFCDRKMNGFDFLNQG